MYLQELQNVTHFAYQRPRIRRILRHNRRGISGHARSAEVVVILLSSSTKTFFLKLPSHPAGEFTLRAKWVIVCWCSVTDDPAARSSAAMVQKMGNMLDTWVDMTSKSGQDIMGGHECVQCAVAWVRTDIICAVAELPAFCSLLINDRMSRLAACFRRRVSVNVSYVYRWNNPLSFTGEDVLLRPLHCTFHPSFCTG